MFSQPAFAVRLADGQTQGQLLEAHGVPCILGIDGQHCVLRVIHVHAVLVVFHTRHAFVHRACGVTELEELEIRIRTLALEFFVATAIQHRLAVNHIGRIRDLKAWNGERRICGAKAKEAYQHLAALVRATLEPFDLLKPFFSLNLIQFLVQVDVRRHQVFCDLFFTRLVVITVKMDRVTFNGQGQFFLVFHRQLATIGGVFIRILADPGTIRLT